MKLPGGSHVERDEELAVLAAALDRALTGEGNAVLVEGLLGVGKSHLLDAVCGLGAARDLGVLRARGSELEADFSFGVARQLFERVVAAAGPDGKEDLLHGSARPARLIVDNAPVAGLTPEVTTHAVLHGLYWLTANLADRRPILLAVDDVQWADAPSVRFLLHLIPRLDGLPILLVLARRPDEPGPDGSLEAIAALDGVAVLRLRPLSEAGTKHLVQSQLTDADETFAKACHRATGGNPFLLGELIRTAKADGMVPAAANAKRVSEVSSTVISRAVLVPLGRLGGAAIRTARAAAVLGRGSRLDHVAAVAGVSAHEADAAADAMALSGVLCAVHPVEFSHPAVQAAIYADIPPAERAQLHRRAARVLTDAGLPASPHLLRSPPAGDPSVVAGLVAAAASALSEGAPDIAATLARRALEEPPDPNCRAAVLRLLGTAEIASGNPGDATAHLREALTLETVPRVRAQVAGALTMAHVLSLDPANAVSVLEDALVEVRGVSHDAALFLEATIAALARIDRRLRARGRQYALGLHGRVPEVGEPLSPGARQALVQLAVESTCAGEPHAAGVALARQALDDGALLADETSDSPAIVLAALVLMFSDEIEESGAVLEAMFEDAAARGSVTAFTQASCFQAHVCNRAGWPSDAEAHARRSLEAPMPQPQLAPMELAALVDALVLLGQLPVARSALQDVPLQGPIAESYHANHLLCSRGWLNLAERRHAEALADFREAGRRQLEWLMPNPAVLDWRSGTARSLVALGRPRVAREVAEEEVELARRFGAPRALGRALLSLAMASDRPIPLLEEAVGVLEDAPAVLDHAEAQLQLGAALRRANRPAAAREPLRRALALAWERKASSLVAQAEDELRAAGARPRRRALTGLDALTASELRVAKLAADGHGNREIAQMLFVTQKTVEDHLGHAYAKLGIPGRLMLPIALRAPGAG